MRNLLLLSTSTVHGIPYLEYASELIKSFFTEFKVQKILFVPYALPDHDAYATKARTAFDKMGFEVESIHSTLSPIESVKTAQAFFIGGGNTFLLLKTLYDLELLEPIRQRVLQDGVPYMGASAGTNMATINICTTNDMPIVHPPSLNALGFLPFNINPHYLDPDPNSKHMGETRETRISEYHSLPDTHPVLGLREGSVLQVRGESITLWSTGNQTARLFNKGQPPKEYGVNDDLSFLFKI